MKLLPKLNDPLIISSLSLLIVSAFFRLYLSIYSNQQLKEFQNQNYKELYAVDTLKISSRLNSLSSAINWVCISAEHGNKSFYKMSKGGCRSGIFKAHNSLSLPEANHLKLNITTRLPQEFEWTFIAFFLSQILIIAAIIKSTRHEEKQKQIHEMQKIKMARQISHDIRSPLATLNTIINNLNLTSDEEKLLLSNALLRINSISNQLLINSKQITSTLPIPVIEEVDLQKIIQEIILEKKIEFSKNKDIQFNFTSHQNLIFSHVDINEFKNILSNLFNNAIEAPNRNNQIIIDIILSIKDDQVIITINDNGQGIPKNLLTKLGHVEFTTKKNGNGIGLISAKESIETWNGKLLVANNTHGASISIELPISQSKNNESILIDDDQLVRLTWNAMAKRKGVQLKTFSDESSFLVELENISKSSNIYIDSKLSNDKKGEDLAVKLSNLGFFNIFMATGYEKDSFSHLKFLKGVRDKSPPW